MHEINLQRAWERHVVARSDASPGCVGFKSRRNIGSGEQVFLVADPCRLRTMWLNGNSLVDPELYKEGHVCISEQAASAE